MSAKGLRNFTVRNRPDETGKIVIFLYKDIFKYFPTDISQ